MFGIFALVMAPPGDCLSENAIGIDFAGAQDQGMCFFVLLNFCV